MDCKQGCVVFKSPAALQNPLGTPAEQLMLQLTVSGHAHSRVQVRLLPHTLPSLLVKFSELLNTVCTFCVSRTVTKGCFSYGVLSKKEVPWIAGKKRVYILGVF